MFWWRATQGRFDRAFTDRDGGSSQGSYAGLNLAKHVDDADGAVEENRTALANSLEWQRDSLVFMNQVHGRDVAVIEQPLADPPTVDAMVTRQPGLALAVMVADCTPVLLRDEESGVVGVAHAGRPGLLKGVVPATLEAMRDLGARRIVADVGPSVCPRCYEVPVDLREEVAAVAPASRSVSVTGTPAIDVAAGVVEQLSGAGVEVNWVPGCTREQSRLYSYRRDGATGRFAGVIGIREESADG